MAEVAEAIRKAVEGAGGLGDPPQVGARARATCGRRAGSSPRSRTGCARLVKPGVSTKEIDADVEAFIVSPGRRLGLQGLPGVSRPRSASRSTRKWCTGSRRPSGSCKEGDIIGLDLGCIVEGYYGDCAITLPVGAVPPRVQELLDVTRESLDKAIVQCRAGNRLGDISHAVQTHCESHGFGVVRAFVGHGIGRSSTRSRRCPNFGDAGRGPVHQGGHGAGHRAHGDHGLVRSAGARGRLDGGDRRRELGRPLRGHHRDHGSGPRSPDPTDRAA